VTTLKEVSHKWITKNFSLTKPFIILPTTLISISTTAFIWKDTFAKQWVAQGVSLTKVAIIALDTKMHALGKDGANASANGWNQEILSSPKLLTRN